MQLYLSANSMCNYLPICNKQDTHADLLEALMV